jgi:hypothetical protein
MLFQVQEKVREIGKDNKGFLLCLDGSTGCFNNLLLVGLDWDMTRKAQDCISVGGCAHVFCF